jgi:rSAM/selenodomain-associated transferase 1
MRLVYLFLRYPESGLVKTRLAETLGPERAAELYRVMVEDLVECLRPLAGEPGWRLLLYATPVQKLRDVVLWLNPGAPPILDAMPQPDAALGERLAHAMHWGFGRLRAEQVFFIGSDCPELGPEHLRTASHLLGSHDAVVGRADDGGFTLLGLRRPAPELFESLAYSRSDTCNQLLQRLGELQFACESQTLPVMADVDRESDLAALPAAVRERLRARAAEQGFDRLPL